MRMQLVLLWLLPTFICPSVAAIPEIQRRRVVERFNVRRNESSTSTPLQVGNGNFAFGADVTGLQTFRPFAIMSTWGWHNFSLPIAPNQTSIDGECRSLRFCRCEPLGPDMHFAQLFCLGNDVGLEFFPNPTFRTPSCTESSDRK